MPSFLQVNNNVSLLTVNIAPSTFLASLTLTLVFLSFYLPSLCIRIPRRFIPGINANTSSRTARKPLPPVPDIDPNELLQDLPLVIDNRAALLLHDHHREERHYHLEQRRRSSSKRMMQSDPLDASLQDFEQPLSPAGHRRMASDPADTESMTDSASNGGYSPPAWRRLGNGDRSSGFWRSPDHFLKAPMATASGFGSADGSGLGGILHRRFSSRDPSVDVDDVDLGFSDGDEALQQAIRTRLPAGSVSPEKERSPEPEFANHTNATTIKFEQRDIDRRLGLVADAGGSNLAHGQAELAQKRQDNFIRFAVSAEMQQKTEPIENAYNFVTKKYRAMTKTWFRSFCSALLSLMFIAALRSLFGTPDSRPVPDLVKVAGIARAFEPLIYYSENGAQQVGDLQATGVAVWDLGESVRTSNMTSGPIIVKELDDLSDSLRTLAIELTKFFANVDGDIDGLGLCSVLIVMDWARRELGQLHQTPPPNLFTSAFDNVHNLLTSAGVLEDARGEPTRAGLIATSIFGMSSPQRTRATVQRTFDEFLAVLEEAIGTELQHSVALFALFEAIDRQFDNLARTVARETSAQDEKHADALSSLWSRLLGPDAGRVAKYERNRLLLQNLREKTVCNKRVLIEHNDRLLALRTNLESLRRKLVSPLVRSVNSSTLSLEEQIRGLDDALLYLDGVRTRQKGKLMEILYGGNGGGEHGRRMITEQHASRN
ncbi:hypothetical protein PpBr36_03149 [Pyricularia pennisetigena]|uniref:hypothetical protein n=1 Tax=Pyricularia pennisetigena TaxID=1578925 RepID=UPI001153C438|nr:hypothetical protein PpBr36_03149 [Pyricularia pennisetigena]TLS30755.1 hypothetical protein PpBr36_03149 [Pyricularia pennisetigena]